METDYEQFCDILRTIEMPLLDVMILQQAAYQLASSRYHKGFNDAQEMALNARI